MVWIDAIQHEVMLRLNGVEAERIAMKWWERAHRRRNHNEPGYAHLLTFSCYRGYKFLTSERACQWLAEAIDLARYELDFALWAFVFMPEHVHLLIFPRQQVFDLGDIRGAIKEPVGRRAIEFMEREAPRWLPRITRRRGKNLERLFWQSGGGHDTSFRDPVATQQVIEYIHNNPVRRKLVQQACDWRWSSAGWFAGAPTCPLVPDKIPAEWWD